MAGVDAKLQIAFMLAVLMALMVIMFNQSSSSLVSNDDQKERILSLEIDLETVKQNARINRNAELQLEVDGHRDAEKDKPHVPPRKIYIDGGANLANSLFLFQEVKTEVSKIPDGPWEVFAFEAIPELAYYTKFVTERLNKGQSIDEARAGIHWDKNTETCVVEKLYATCVPTDLCCNGLTQ